MTKTHTAKPKIEFVSTDALTPCPTNSKSHSAEKIAAVANSIKQFGFTAPVLIDEDGAILAGHCRVTAAQSIDYDPVPCVRIKHLSETQKRAYVIADNKLAEFGSEWDEDMLAAELADLGTEDFDLGSLGFADEDLAELLGTDTDEDPKTGLTKEIDSDSFDMECKCPKCGFEFDQK